MKVFISWSGDRSKQVALALRDWLPKVIQRVKPWMSDRDVDAGVRWFPEISEQLESSNFGIVCLTPENKERPWIMFEAGALAKKLSASLVCPYLFDLDQAQVAGPPSQFQSVKADEEGTSVQSLK